jgi:hypothetical protein
MRFLTIHVTDGDSKSAVTFNMDHIVKVDHDDDDLIIHLSTGDTHYVDADSKNELRTLLTNIHHHTKGHPDQ